MRSVAVSRLTFLMVVAVIHGASGTPYHRLLYPTIYCGLALYPGLETKQTPVFSINIFTRAIMSSDNVHLATKLTLCYLCSQQTAVKLHNLITIVIELWMLYIYTIV